MRYFYLVLGLMIFPGISWSSEDTLECSIKSVLQLNNTGSLVSHGWSANYLNREFTLDKNTGKVVSTTALKVRLSNYDAENQPVVLDHEIYQAITIFENKNTYAAIEIAKTPDEQSMPYFYRTNIGMMLAGTCNKKVDRVVKQPS